MLEKIKDCPCCGQKMIISEEELAIEKIYKKMQPEQHIEGRDTLIRLMKERKITWDGAAILMNNFWATEVDDRNYCMSVLGYGFQKLNV